MGEPTTPGTIDVPKKHRLRIVFDGVIAVGPPPPDKGKKRQGPYFGVMARSIRRLSDRSRRLNEKPPKYIPMHVPSLYTTLEAVGDGRKPDQVFQLLRGDPKWNIWHPVRERLEFRFDGDGKPRDLTYDDPAVLAQRRKPGEVRLHSIRKAPDARKISPDRHHLLAGLLSPDAPVREEAAAQILIPWGKVAGGGIFDKENGVDVFFESARTKSRVRQVVPNTVVSVDVENVEIVTYSLESGEQLDSLMFHLEDDAEIWISNGDPSDTAIDLEKLSDERRGKRRPDAGRLEKLFTSNFEKRSGAKASASMRSEVRAFIGGSPLIPPSILENQPNRSSPFDLDFELFATITGARGDSEAVAMSDHVPVPVRAKLLDFEGPNCLVQQVETDEALVMKSNGDEYLDGTQVRRRK